MVEATPSPVARQLFSPNAHRPSLAPLKDSNVLASRAFTKRPSTLGVSGAPPPSRLTTKRSSIATFQRPAAFEPPGSTNSKTEISADQLKQIIMEQQAKAAQFEDEVSCTNTNVEARLGESLHARATDLNGLMKEWDTKSGDGTVRKMDFRLHVRKLVTCGPTETSEIDALFTRLDKRRQGTIELREVKPMLRALQERAALVAEHVQRAQSMIDRYRERAEQAQHCMAAVAMAEQGEAKYAHLRDSSGSVQARFGALLAKRSKIGEVVSKWDSRGSGALGRRDFVAATKAIGLQAEPGEVDELFATLDRDGTGSLDVIGLRTTLAALAESAANAEEELLRAAKFSAMLRKAAKGAHASLLQAIEEDEVEGQRIRLEAEVAARHDGGQAKMAKKGGSPQATRRKSVAPGQR